jgi:hypothetical protein
MQRRGYPLDPCGMRPSGRALATAKVGSVPAGCRDDREPDHICVKRASSKALSGTALRFAIRPQTLLALYLSP